MTLRVDYRDSAAPKRAPGLPPHSRKLGPFDESPAACTYSSRVEPVIIEFPCLSSSEATMSSRSGVATRESTPTRLGFAHHPGTS